MDELEVSEESSSSIRGAGGGKDFLLDLGMMGYRGTQRAILSHMQKRLRWRQSKLWYKRNFWNYTVLQYSTLCIHIQHNSSESSP